MEVIILIVDVTRVQVIIILSAHQVIHMLKELVPESPLIVGTAPLPGIGEHANHQGMKALYLPARVQPRITLGLDLNLQGLKSRLGCFSDTILPILGM